MGHPSAPLLIPRCIRKPVKSKSTPNTTAVTGYSPPNSVDATAQTPKQNEIQAAPKIATNILRAFILV